MITHNVPNRLALIPALLGIREEKLSKKLPLRRLAPSRNTEYSSKTKNNAATAAAKKHSDLKRKSFVFLARLDVLVKAPEVANYITSRYRRTIFRAMMFRPMVMTKSVAPTAKRVK